MYQKYSNVVYEQYNSIGELLKVIKERPVQAGFEYHQSSQKRGDKGWYGTSSYAEAEELLINGWDKYLAEIRKDVIGSSLNKIEQGILNKRRPQISVVGFTPHIPNAILGLPQSMIDIKQEPQKVKTITLIFNTSVTAEWEPKQVLKSGIAVLRLVNKIERDGVKVRLVNEFKSSRGRNSDLGIVRVILKDFKDHLDLKKIAFPFSNVGMMRRIGFKWLETVPAMRNGHKWVSGGFYGSSIGDCLDNDTLIDTLKYYDLLKENEYYITVQRCTNDCGNDPVKLAEKLNIKY